jgi:hypothetical protein
MKNDDEPGENHNDIGIRASINVLRGERKSYNSPKKGSDYNPLKTSRGRLIERTFEP